MPKKKHFYVGLPIKKKYLKLEFFKQIFLDAFEKTDQNVFLHSVIEVAHADVTHN